jgi:prevent-host-death family protein
MHGHCSGAEEPATPQGCYNSGRFNQLRPPTSGLMETQTIGLFEAKTHLSELVARAEQGGEVIITRHNRPVAKIVPIAAVAPFDADRRRAAIAGLRALGRDSAREQGPISADEIVQWVRQGRDEKTDRIERAERVTKATVRKK